MANFDMNVVNEAGTTLYGVCVVHYAEGVINAFYSPSLAPGATAGPVPCSSDGSDRYFIAFGLVVNLPLLGNSAVLKQSWGSCSIRSNETTSLMVHLALENYRIQYNNKDCSSEEYDANLQLAGGKPADSEETRALPPTENFDLRFLNVGVSNCYVSLLHITNGGQTPSSSYWEVPAGNSPPSLPCFNNGQGTGDLYSIIYMADGNVYIGSTSSKWDGAPTVAFTAPEHAGSHHETAFSFRYSTWPVVDVQEIIFSAGTGT